MPNISAPMTARPTIYKGVEMRSRLEAWWAERFDKAGVGWEYEPSAFADESGQYLPDFRYTQARPGGRTATVYLEAKGVVADPAPFCTRMEIIWSTDPTATLMLAEGHGERFWMGYTAPDGSAVWCSHEDDEMGECA